jgi:hypothetical protein
MADQLWGVVIGGLLGLGGATLTPSLAARRDRARSRAFVRAYLTEIWITRVNAAVGNCCQITRSSAVIVSHPNVYMYRPGSLLGLLVPCDLINSQAIPLRPNVNPVTQQ